MSASVNLILKPDRAANCRTAVVFSSAAKRSGATFVARVG